MRAVPRQRRNAAPDMKTLRSLYVDEGRTERETAQLLGISRSHVAETMEQAGIERRPPRRACPVARADLSSAFAAPGATIASLARRFNVSDATAARWLADEGLLPPDPDIDHRHLERLYVEETFTVREVAEKLRLTPGRVSRELAVAGIPTRSNHVRRPRANRADVTDGRLVELYVEKKHNVVETAAMLGVSTEYLRKRLGEAGLIKRPGTFTAHVPWEPDELRQLAADLYQGGMSMKAAGEELGVSVGTVRVALHKTGIPVRRAGRKTHQDEPRTLLDDLYDDPDVLTVLARHQVAVPEKWTPAGPFESLAPLPLPAGLVTELYDDVGLPILHISLLLGVGQGAVRNRLTAADVALRPAGQAAPWTVKTISTRR